MMITLMTSMLMVKAKPRPNTRMMITSQPRKSQRLLPRMHRKLTLLRLKHRLPMLQRLSSAASTLDLQVGWAFLPVETQSDKNVQPTYQVLIRHSC
jgi:hypothetical protein